MFERAAFIHAILDNPDDDTARLVFADWLQEHGEPDRAEFIRLQIEAAKLPEAKRGASNSGKRAAALEAKYGVVWREAVGLREFTGEFARGFLTGLAIFVFDTQATAWRVLNVEPAEYTLYLEETTSDDAPRAPEHIASLTTNPLLRAVTKVLRKRTGYGSGSELFARLMKSPYLLNLRGINLSDDPIGMAGVKVIAGAPAAFTLEHLSLSTYRGPDNSRETDALVDAVRILATSPRFLSLKYLRLSFGPLSNESVQFLLASKTLPATMRLDLEDNDYDEERFEEELAERFRFGFDGGEDEDD